MEAGVLKIFNIQYVWGSIFISLEKFFNFWKLSDYSNSFIFILYHFLNGTKRRLDAAVILIEFFMPKTSCKISASPICFGLLFQPSFGRPFYNETAFSENLLVPLQARSAGFPREKLSKHFRQLILSLVIILIIEFKKRTKTSQRSHWDIV